jgi:hypothetical protein
MRKRLAVAAILVGAFFNINAAFALPGAEKLPFFGGFRASAYCDGSGILPSPQTLPTPDFGFALIQATPNGRVQATVTIREYPNSYYTIRLIQGQADCHSTDWAGFTNSSGAATVHLSEASTSSTAFVHVDQWVTIQGMVFEINSSYVTQTYRH